MNSKNLPTSFISTSSTDEPSTSINETLNQNNVDFTVPIVHRKRIYGEEYRTTLSLNVEPNPKNIRLDQIIYEGSMSQYQKHPIPGENITETICNKIYTKNKIMWPTPTERFYEKFKIDSNLISSICDKCFSINCICQLFNCNK